ncbi:MAG: hypothetical protein AAF750_07850 [Planctomycetota bacterium]
MRSLFALTLVTALAATLFGCSTAPDPAGPATAAAEPRPSLTPIPADQYHPTLDAARRALLDLGYTLDRDDHRFGVLTTKPRASATLAEVWRPDNRTADLATESTLVDLRRTVRITLTPLTRSNPLTPFALGVEVLIARRQAPLRYLNGSARSVFASLNALPEEWEARGIEPEYWQPVKRDPALEAHLTQRILDRLSSAAPQKPTD